jgi:hypothetical protein
MRVMAFNTPSRPDWRWRISNYAGQMIDESRDRFPTIAAAVEEGARVLAKMDVADRSDLVRARPRPRRGR